MSTSSQRTMESSDDSSTAPNSADEFGTMKDSDTMIHISQKSHQPAVDAISKSKEKHDSSSTHIDTVVSDTTSRSIEDNGHSSASSRPDSLSLASSRGTDRSHRTSVVSSTSSSSIADYVLYGSTEQLIEAMKSTPLDHQGTLTEDDGMMSFVAEDLNEQIRLSSPLSRTSADGSWSGSITSSASGWSALSNSGMSRSPSVVTQSPEDIPPIDPKVIHDIEAQARAVAENLDHITRTMHSNIHKMSAITATCLETYKDSVDYTCDSVDACIKSMYAMMAKCEELSKTMKPIYGVANEIKEIKRLLDLFEANLTREDT